MVTLLSPIRIDKGAIVLWLCEAFDEHYSFRAALAELEQALSSSSASASHDLPEEWPMEDFVDGLFHWGDRQFALYYERSLGYMQFSSESLSDLEALYAALSLVTRVRTQQMA